MATLTETGIVIESFDAILSKLEQGFRAIYGQNINLNADTPDGQMIGLLAQMRMDFEELAQTVYNQLDPDAATGAWLEQRVAYAGLMRRAASYSYLRSVILTGEPYTQLYAGVMVSDPNKTRWVLVSDVQLNLGKNTPLTIETITLGLQRATTFENAEVGEDEETDQQLRERFWVSRTKNATNSAEAIAAKIRALPDVKQVRILENNGAQRDKLGIEPHSLNVIVEGGENSHFGVVIYF